MNTDIKPAILDWETPAPRSTTLDPELVRVTLAAIKEKADADEQAVLAREVSQSWGSSNKLAKALKAEGCKISTRKTENGKFNVYNSPFI